MIPCLQAIAQFEFPDDRISKSSFAEIAETDRTAFLMVKQQVGVRVPGETHENIQAVAFASAIGLPGRFLPDFNAILFCQVTNGFHIAEALVLHNKGDGVATLTAAEILKNSLCRDHVKRCGLLVGERTQGLIILAGALEGHEVADHVDQVDPVFYLINGLSGNHSGRCALRRKDTFLGEELEKGWRLGIGWP